MIGLAGGVCGAWASATIAAPINGDGFLRADGVVLRDHKGHGNIVLLKGANLGGWLEWQNWMCPMDSSGTTRGNNPGANGYDFVVRRLLTKRFGKPTADDLIKAYQDAWIQMADLDNIRALGMNVVRLTLSYDSMLNEDGSWRPDAFARLDWFIDNASARGIYTVVDLHAFLPALAEQDGSATGYWTSPKQLDETMQIWTRIADHCRGNPAVAMYDLLNEPINSYPKGKARPKAAVVCDVYDRLYHAIRRVDPDHAIAMEGIWGWKTLRDPKAAGYENVVYSFHWYHNAAKTLADNDKATDDDIAGAAAMQAAWQVPCFVGEFNLGDDSAAWEYGLDHYAAAGLSWAMWSYKDKASGSNRWGIYTTLPGRAPATPNLVTDSADTIRSQWKRWSTQDAPFALNPVLAPVILKHCEGK